MILDIWQKKIIAARKRFKRGVMGQEAPVEIPREDIERLRELMINRALKRFTKRK